MKLRRLNDNGVTQLEEFLDSLTTDSPEAYPAALLEDAAATEVVEPQVEIEKLKFNSRFEAAQYLHGKLADTGISDVERDKGLWSWLALFYFDLLCTQDKNGRRKPGERARWIPAVSNYQRYYRHLLAGPYRIYRAHSKNPQCALALLCQPLNQPGDIVEQLASRQELVANAGVMEATTALYINEKTRQPKRGASGKSGGSARRLADVLNQFDLTWDLYALQSQVLLEMLPSEFSKFQAK